MALFGAICFGVVIGWITYRTLRRKETPARISDITAVVGAVGGGAVTAIFDSQNLFGAYSFGLALGFFGYFAAAKGWRSSDDGGWMGD
jgi:uncharacterized membrane protein YeaQ/YmgE (transglycosylase-associated protein family)